MNRNRTVRYLRFSRILILLGAGLLCLLTGRGAVGEDPAPENRPGPGSVFEAADPVLQPGIVREITDRPFSFFEPPSPVRVGFEIEGHYNDNVFIASPGAEQGDFVLEIIPEVIFESSEPSDGKRYYLTFGYDPQVLRYLDFSSLDAYNHRGYIQWRVNGNRVDAAFFHRSAQYSGTQQGILAGVNLAVDADVGRRTAGDRHLTQFTTDVEVGDRTVLESRLQRFEQSIISLRPLNSEWQFADFNLVHQVAPKTEMGVGTALGQIEFEDSPETSYQQAVGVIRYSPSENLAIDLRGGADFRQFGGLVGGEDQNTPIVTARFVWTPRDATLVALNLFREVTYSVEGDSIVRTGGRGTLRQRLGGKVYYSLVGGYELRDYHSTVRGRVTDREDDYAFLYNRLDYEMSDRRSVGLFHECSRNVSNTATSFNQNLVGVWFSIGF